MSPYDFENYGYVPLAGNNSTMLNNINSAEGNPFASPVQKSTQSAAMQRAAAPFDTSANHYSNWGLDDSHLGQADQNGNRVVNKAGLQAMQNHASKFTLPDNSSVIRPTVGNMLQAPPTPHMPNPQQPGPNKITERIGQNMGDSLSNKMFGTDMQGASDKFANGIVNGISDAGSAIGSGIGEAGSAISGAASTAGSAAMEGLSSLLSFL